MPFLELERFGALVQTHNWRYARTMPQWPHWYTLRKDWRAAGEDSDFVFCARYIREAGYTTRWHRRKFIELAVNEHHYWTMGAPITDDPTADLQIDTSLINRAAHLYPAAYDAVADNFDALYDAPLYRDEERQFFDMAGDCAGLSVLDVGCGTGLALRYLAEDCWYTGIDPSPKMLQKLREEWVGVQTLATPLSSFVGPLAADGGPARYDRVLCLFGVAGYLSDEELARIPTLLRPGGVAYVMFTEEGYVPLTHSRCGVTTTFRPWRPGLVPGGEHVATCGSHLVIRVEAPAL